MTTGRINQVATINIEIGSTSTLQKVTLRTANKNARYEHLSVIKHTQEQKDSNKLKPPVNFCTLSDYCKDTNITHQIHDHKNCDSHPNATLAP